MFAPNKNDLIKSLCKLSANLCSYIKKPCDCKFINTDSDKVATGSENGSGCPEALVVATLLNNMTEQEFNALCQKAGLLITEENHPQLNIMEIVNKFQEDRWVDGLKKITMPTPKSKNIRSAYEPGKLPTNGLKDKPSLYQPRRIPKGKI